MNKLISTLRSLTKLASDLDSKGKYAEADLIEQALMAIAQEDLTPTGQPYTENGKTYQKFYNPSKGLITREINSDGSPISVDKPSTEPSFFEKYNPFPGLSSALSGQGDKATYEQERSESPLLNKSDDFADPHSALTNISED